MSASKTESTRASELKVLAVVVFYLVAALMMVTVNKWVLNSAALPVSFLFCQLVIAVILLLLCHAVRLINLPRLDWSIGIKLRPLIAVNVLGLVFNNLCLQYVDASFYQIARGLVLPITVGLALGLHHAPPSPLAFACCAAITVGFLVGVTLDSKSSIPKEGFSFIGVVFGLLSSCTTAVHSIVIKSCLPTVDNSVIHLAWYSNLFSAIAMLPMIAIAGELSPLLELGNDANQLRIFIWGSLITGVFGFLICVAGFMSIKVTSPVTHMVSSAARGVIQTILSVILFGDVISRARAGSIFIITVASCTYVSVKHEEQKQKPAVKEIPEERHELVHSSTEVDESIEKSKSTL